MCSNPVGLGPALQMVSLWFSCAIQAIPRPEAEAVTQYSKAYAGLVFGSIYQGAISTAIGQRIFRLKLFG